MHKKLPDNHHRPDHEFTQTHEGATAFSIHDPFVTLIFTYGSFIPETESAYSSPELQMGDFILAVQDAANANPELALQYAAWLRDPRRGKGNRSQSPWVIAILAQQENAYTHPRFTELVAKCIFRPDDALHLIQATSALGGDNQFPTELKAGIAQGLNTMTDYQLAKYAQATLNLLPAKKKKEEVHIPLHAQKQAILLDIKEGILSPQEGEAHLEILDKRHQLLNKRMAALRLKESKKDTVDVTQTDTAQITETLKAKKNFLRMVDVLGICKEHLSPRLFALYRYLHAPTRMQTRLLPMLAKHIPLFRSQKYVYQNTPQSWSEVKAWLQEALTARMTMEQILSATGMPAGEQALLRSQQKEAAEEKKNALSLKQKSEHKKHVPSHSVTTTSPEIVPPILRELQEHKQIKQAIHAEIWKHLLHLRVADEQNSTKNVPFLGDVALLRNVRNMTLAGVSIEQIQNEVQTRPFHGVWPYQVLSAARTVQDGKSRKNYTIEPFKDALPIFENIFEQIATRHLPKKADGSLYRILGMADISGSMEVRLGNKHSSATCMDAALAISAACSHTLRTSTFHGLAGTWDYAFHPVLLQKDERLISMVDRILQSGGGGGTQVFRALIDLITWLEEHPSSPHPEAVIILSDMQFHPPASVSPVQLSKIPAQYRNLISRHEFRQMPPLAAAIKLYRLALGNDVSIILWNLASYKGSPVFSDMDRVLMLSGFDTNSFRTIEKWLQAGSPGTAMPTQQSETEESSSSFDIVLATLKTY